MILEAGSLIYKSVDPKYYRPGEEFDTSTYNYGLAVTRRSGRERAEFDQFMSTSRATRQKLGNFLTPALSRVGTGLEGRRYGAAFREHFLERVRAEVSPTAPRRRDAVFFGMEKSDVERFCELASPKNWVLVTVEVVHCDAMFLGDMALLDEFEVFQHDYTQARYIAERYWRGERVQDPCLELLAQGRFKWGRLV